MPQLKVIVVDENAVRREQIKSFLPEYMDVYTSGYGDSALKYIKAENDGIIPDLVILYGDDSKGQGLYIFDWMINRSGKADIAEIPVIVVCSDEFSDRSLDFLEIGDVFYYEGEVDEDRLFSLVTEALDAKEFANEPAEPHYEEGKSIDRLMGQSVKVTPSIPGKERKVVLDMDTQLKNLEAALMRGQKRAEEIRAVLEAAQKNGVDEVEYVLRNRKKSHDSDKDASKAVTSSQTSSGSGFLKTLKKQHNTEQKPNIDKSDSVEEKLKKLRERAMSSPDSTFMAQARTIKREMKKAFVPGQQGASNASSGSVKSSAHETSSNATLGVSQSGGYDKRQAGCDFSGQVVKQNQYNQNANNQNVNIQNGQPQKWRIVVVDDDPGVTKSMEMYLSSRYEVISFSSGMKAIDFFIRNTADLLVIDAVMPGMGGAQAVGSIRYQAGGVKVPVLYLAGADYQGPREMLSGSYVVGVLTKPITPGTVAMAVDGFFRGR